MHCFTGNTEQAQECLELGFHLAFGGVTTFPKASEIREAARMVPADRLLLETDSPYLAPIPHRGKRNEPSFVAHTAEVIARVREVLARRCWRPKPLRISNACSNSMTNQFRANLTS